jgi:IPT/TIG domain/Stigma-specific protein, Stig1/Kelch motif
MKRASLSLAAVLACLAPVFAACGSDAPIDSDAGTDAGSDSPQVCSAPKVTCGTACVDTSADPQNCGGCSTACQAGDHCCSSKCVKGASCEFAVTKVNPFKGNQSGGDWIKLEGAGFTPDMSVFIGDGRAAVRVIDSSHAIIQTPPGPVGTYDITIKNASNTSTTRASFVYVSAGLLLPWQKKPMQTVRGEHPGVAVLQDGRVLVAGGTEIPDDPTKALTTGEIYTRASDTVVPVTNNMAVKRWRDAAVTMLDGRVVIAGAGECTLDACKAIDLFDPAKNDTFLPSKALLSEPRDFAFGVLMVDGRAMFISDNSPTVDIYDTDKDSITTVPLKVTHRFGARIVRMRDGRVMVMGGDGCSGTCGLAQNVAEVFDPATGQFALVAPMKKGRSQFTAHVLPDGRVMVFGGASSSAGGVANPMPEIESYDPKTDTWTEQTYKLTTGRTWHASALVRDGTILVMGGYTQNASCAPTATVDQVDPVAGTVVSFGTLPDPNTEWNAVTLLDGSVLGVGGGACGGNALPDLDFLPGAPAPQ